MSSSLSLSASIVTASLIIGASIVYHSSRNKYEITGGSAAYLRLDKASGAVTVCYGLIDKDGKLSHRVMDCSGITPQHP